MADDTLFGLFSLLVQAITESKYLFGEIGIKDNNQWLVKVPNKPNFVYVRVFKPTGASVDAAICNRVTPKPNLLVRMIINSDGVLEVQDAVSAASLASTGVSGVNLSVGPHSHRLGLGNEDLVEDRRFEPGALYIDSERGGLWVKVMRLPHSDGLFLGKAVNLSYYKPASLSEKKLIKLGIDKDLNDLEIVEGNTVSIAYPISDQEAYDLAFVGTNVIPSGALVLRGDQNILSQSTKFIDLRQFADVGSGGGGASFAFQSMKISKLTGGSVSIAFLNAVSQQVTGFSENIDTLGGIDIGTHDERITIPTGEGGNYHIGYHIQIPKLSTFNAWDLLVEIKKNGSTWYKRDHIMDWTRHTNQTEINVSSLHLDTLAAGDYLQMYLTIFDTNADTYVFTCQMWAVKYEEEGAA